MGAEVASAAKESEAVSEELREQVAVLEAQLADAAAGKDEAVAVLRAEIEARELRIEVPRFTNSARRTPRADRCAARARGC